MRIARVFPRKTNMTPTDELAFYTPPALFIPEVDEVHVSVTFTYDIPKADAMAFLWGQFLPTKMSGPALGTKGGDFEPGMYLKKGLVITSRGCPNRDCWFCEVPIREGREIRTLPIRDGWNVLDDNLLACPEEHIRGVFAMLARQKAEGKRIVFSGGLEAARLRPWMAEELRKLKPRRMYFAYDTEDDYEPLVGAGKLLRSAGFTTRSHSMCCYVLIGYPGDSMAVAEGRLLLAIGAGFTPYAMLYRDKHGHIDPDWARFQRQWVRPQLIYGQETQ